MNLNNKARSALAQAMAMPLRTRLDYSGLGGAMITPIVTRIFMSDDIHIDIQTYHENDKNPTYIFSTDKFEIHVPIYGKLRVNKVRKQYPEPVYSTDTDEETKDEKTRALQQILKYASVLEDNLSVNVLDIEIPQEQFLEMFTKRENGKIVYANAKDVNDKIENMLIVG